MPDESETKLKHAVVLSGGGANGAYEIGTLKALVAGKSPTTKGEPLEPDIFCGTSVGAFNSAYLVSRWEEEGPAAVSSLEQLWLRELASRPGKSNGVFRLRGSAGLFSPRALFPNPFKPVFTSALESGGLAWEGIERLVSVGTAQGEPIIARLPQLLNLSSFISTAPLRRLVEAINYQSIRSSPKTLRIAATDWTEGREEIFDRHQMTETFGPQVVLASAAIPGFFPPANIGARPYVDGGVLMNSPLRPAIQAQADVIHVITLNPEVHRIPLAPMTNTLSTVWRQQVIGWAKTVSQDIERARLLNRLLEITEEISAHLADDEAHALEYSERGLPGIESGAALKEAIGQEVRGRRPIKIYLYRPNDDLGGPLGLLNFKADRLEQLIERGFNDTVGWVREEANYVDPYPLRYRLSRDQWEDSNRSTIESDLPLGHPGSDN